MSMSMTREEFDSRILELTTEMREKKAGCFVHRCPCGVEGAWYEGVLDYLFQRCNEPCRSCGRTDKTLHLGIGEKYELW